MEGIFVLYLVVIVVALWFYFLPWTMASNRGRSGLGFFLLGLVTTPIVAIIVLLLIGPAIKAEAQSR